MTTIKGARARARLEVTAAIKDEARRQLAEEGAAKLSLRAVARELGMVSSALYRYFPSRDDLLTALIIDAYDQIGAAAEFALRQPPRAGTDVLDVPLVRWTAVCRAVRSWALDHPHEYALIYGSPVPGYTAPQDTVGPAARVGGALIAVARDARRAGVLAVPPLDTELVPEARRLAAQLAPDLPAAVVVALVAAWSQLFGLISFELFGQFHGVVEDRDAFFGQAVARLGRDAGLHSLPTVQRVHDSP
ncbi:TetR/AcrR family transcriptional regulator [Streptomyces clavuligerus]|uniref:TetR family transcriptional regulator n=1 Tax=Streptomyces clavuligerus TaxID=1901 RepID=B5H2E7_STRCL|nr:TetR/AcrR family transcriptional regulator [Streptomyces clavuligerus]ANW21486.1 TetR family transcriptional regulator [Streptomyces clavuligerus]AXU16119.1 TetR/AcrR family transcriptional regulator [Streptomyces clavuligerus]EDY52743.1 TetR-family transcriptional regulator [Streptomyces clavuligerus]EFG05355.1 TetR family transcriptional regulator [Streptomyces clavuligerus]MBY6306260.1 TetR/AcrR family transcriptional regulator [Streptomyces clavuligerus]